MARKQRSGNAECIHSRKRASVPEPPAVFPHEADIKGHIVTDKDTAFGKREESWENLLDRIGVYYHVIRYACQLCDPVWDRHLRVDKFRKSSRDLAVLYFDGAKLNDPVLFR